MITNGLGFFFNLSSMGLVLDCGRLGWEWDGLVLYWDWWDWVELVYNLRWFWCRECSNWRDVTIRQSTIHRLNQRIASTSTVKAIKIIKIISPDHETSIASSFHPINLEQKHRPEVNPHFVHVFHMSTGLLIIFMCSTGLQDCSLCSCVPQVYRTAQDSSFQAYVISCSII